MHTKVGQWFHVFLIHCHEQYCIFFESVLWQRPLKDGGTCLLSYHFLLERTWFIVRCDGRLRYLSFAKLLSDDRRERERGHTCWAICIVSAEHYSILHYVHALTPLSLPFSVFLLPPGVTATRSTLVGWTIKWKRASVFNFLSLDFLEESWESGDRRKLSKCSSFSF